MHVSPDSHVRHACYDESGSSHMLRKAGRLPDARGDTF
jgi:hypothetical protein